eukprot:TRINITY_DN16538_c0_g1_i1.p1 TRINITY_DN16538_c0_g1~~TRINITY_DN16538_c0_g1_i1.p1  ORF type:complete len:878 (-),score=167.80 TRINITY_DN16538_c0_g1_i1:264-2897(-)
MGTPWWRQVAAMGLDPHKHLGKSLEEMQPELKKLARLYGINVCGEGGEYETITLDCPVFRHARIVLDAWETRLHSLGSVAVVGVLHPTHFHLEEKDEGAAWIEPGSERTTSESVIDARVIEVDDVREDVREDDDQTQSSGEVDAGGEGEGGGASEMSRQGMREAGTGSTVVLQDGVRLSLKSGARGWQMALVVQRVTGEHKDIGEELALFLNLAEEHLLRCRLSWAQALYVHLYLANMTAFDAANRAYVASITDAKCAAYGVPSRSTLEVDLEGAGMGSVALDVMLRLGEGEEGAPAQGGRAGGLHVQSISLWAPACIGPYSQCTRDGSLLLLAGQLGLDPPTMALVPGGSAPQTIRALLSCEAIARAFGVSIQGGALCFTVYCAAVEEGQVAAVEEIAKTINEFLICCRKRDLFEGVMQTRPQAPWSRKAMVALAEQPIREAGAPRGGAVIAEKVEGLERGSYLDREVRERFRFKEYKEEEAIVEEIEEEDEEEEEEEEDGSSLGLLLAKTGECIKPLFRYVVVPGLPKGARVEIAPILYSPPAGFNEEPWSSSSDEEEEEPSERTSGQEPSGQQYRSRDQNTKRSSKGGATRRWQRRSGTPPPPEVSSGDAARGESSAVLTRSAFSEENDSKPADSDPSPSDMVWRVEWETLFLEDSFCRVHVNISRKSEQGEQDQQNCGSAPPNGFLRDSTRSEEGTDTTPPLWGNELQGEPRKSGSERTAWTGTSLRGALRESYRCLREGVRGANLVVETDLLGERIYFVPSEVSLPLLQDGLTEAFVPWPPSPEGPSALDSHQRESPNTVTATLGVTVDAQQAVISTGRDDELRDGPTHSPQFVPVLGIGSTFGAECQVAIAIEWTAISGEWGSKGRPRNKI